MVDVSVIIVNLNGLGFLKECLPSVMSAAVSKELIVVDNGSTDGSVEFVRSHYPEARLILNMENLRFAKPNNDGMKLATGRYYFLLNNDTIVGKGTVERLVRYMDEHPDVGVVGPQLRNPDGTIQRSCRGLFTLWSHFCDMTALDALFPHSKIFGMREMMFFDHQSERCVDHLMAAAILVRPHAVAEVGMLDEAMTIYLNDMDWSLRFHQAGWKSIFLPDVKVTHFGGGTTRTMNVDYALIREMQENCSHYYRKHYGVIGFLFLRFFQILGFSLRLAGWFCSAVVRSDHQSRLNVTFFYFSLRYALTEWRSART